MLFKSPGVLAIVIIAAIVGAALGALIYAGNAEGFSGFWNDLYLWRVVRFTFWQATLSTLLSVCIGVLVARAFARQQVFPGRSLLLKLYGLPMVVPTIVAVFGIVAIYGQNGLINRLAQMTGLDTTQYLYGLPGILIAHVFFNFPLAVRLLLPLWNQIPGESWRIAAQLEMSSGSIFRILEWPLIRQSLPGVIGLVFMLCFTSFAVILVLGGGPAATTIEVAIYQALRFDFELNRAVSLAMLQILICGGLLAVIQVLSKPMEIETGLGHTQPRPDADRRWAKAWDSSTILIATLSLALPLSAVLLSGILGPITKVFADSTVWDSVLRSVTIAVSAGVLALALGWSLLQTSRNIRLARHNIVLAESVTLVGSLILVVPPIVLGTGFFILFSSWTDLFSNWGLLLVVLINALMGIPYVIRVMGPGLLRIGEQHHRLCASLDMRGLNRLRLVEWPLIRRQAGLALALCSALSIGDLGVIALFGTTQTATLPFLLYQKMGSYRLDEAAVIALLLLLLCLGLFLLFERVVGGPKNA